MIQPVYRVSQLNSEVRTLLEGSFPLIWLEGEISNLAKPSSGHLYFTLKDEIASVRCAMFRQRNRLLGFTPENGMHILMRAQVSLYEGRGEFQLIGEHMEEAGDGVLRRAFEALKQRLATEGLFDAAHKKPLPAMPRCIGVVTSPTGAAIRDILSILQRRFPALPVIIYPVQVQGAAAAVQIAQAIRTASQRNECEVLIVSRGGGSLEDLWAFNEEVVARAIYACAIPVVSGIGHEVDFTIADFVADQRAATPSAAAELVSPDQTEWLQQFARQHNRLATLMQDRITRKRQMLDWLVHRLQQQHSGQRLRNQSQRLDELEQRLHSALHRTLEKSQQRFISASRALDTVSPLATLARGYAIVQRVPLYTPHKTAPAALVHPPCMDAQVPRRHDAKERPYTSNVQVRREAVRSTRGIAPGDKVEARLAQGRLLCKVEEVIDE